MGVWKRGEKKGKKWCQLKDGKRDKATISK